MDSKLVVEQMSGRWKIKHEDMRRLALQARDVVRRDHGAGGSVTYRWVPREREQGGRRPVQRRDGRVARSTGSSAASPALDEIPAARPGRPGAGGADPDPTGRTLGQRRRRRGRAVAARRPASSSSGTASPTSLDRRLDGRGGPDPSLSAVGRAQARAAGRGGGGLRRATGALGSSPPSLARARETGAVVAAALGVEPRRRRRLGRAGLRGLGRRARSPTCSRTHRDEFRPAARRPGLRPARRGDARRDGRAGARRRSTGSSPRAGRPSSSATASRSWSSSRTCSGSPTTGSGGWPPPPARLPRSRCGRGRPGVGRVHQPGLSRSAGSRARAPDRAA